MLQYSFQAVLVMLFSIAISACSADSDRNNSANGDGNGDNSDGWGTEDSDSPFGSDKDTDTNCYEEVFPIEIVPTRVMLLVDVSSSMTQEAGGGVKWFAARDAILAALGPWVADDAIEFGIDFFPNHVVDGCAINTSVVYDVSPLSAQEIIDGLTDVGAKQACDGATPLCAALNNFDVNHQPGYAPKFTDGDANKYVIIVSDGSDTCGNNEGGNEVCMEYLWEETVANALLTNNIKTYAIGFHTDAMGSLDMIMAAGGTGLTSQISANDQATLQAELDNIAKDVVSCTFELDDAAAPYVDDDEINFYTDGTIIKYDENCEDGSGWEWIDDQKNQFRLCPDACEKLQNDQIENVTATFGCPTEILV